MEKTSRTFRIFVSSTFNDLKAERNALQEKVFPRLRELCYAHGCRFQAIDLRWGVSAEAALDQQTMKICLGEIERCQKTSPRPNFIVLLGDRYGWRPLAGEIPADEFEQIIALVNSTDRTLVETWYRRDNNAVPPVYCLQQRAGDTKDKTTWGQIEKCLHRILTNAIRHLDINPDKKLKYIASATEQEIMAGALSVPDAPKHVSCYFRQIEGLPHNESAAEFVDLDADSSSVHANTQSPIDFILSRFKLNRKSNQVVGDAEIRLADLKKRLRDFIPGGTHTYKSRWMGNSPSLDHLDQLCEDVFNDLQKILLAEIAQLEEIDPLDREINTHTVFSRELVRHFTGRVIVLKCIADYLASDNCSPLAVWGNSGCGKSAIIAKAVQQAGETQPFPILVYRFIGASPDSSDCRTLLETLCRQITRTYGGDENSVSHEYDELVEELPRRLSLASQARPLILFLDALDQLADVNDARKLSWLPSKLPEHVKIVVSTLPGEYFQALPAMPIENLLEIQRLQAIDGERILDAWLTDARRTLQPGQKEHILARFSQQGLPLFLKLAFEDSRRWKSYDITRRVSNDIPSQIHQFFNRLSLSSNHGEILVARSLGYLAAARNGLSEDELLDILSHDKDIYRWFLGTIHHTPTDLVKAVISYLGGERCLEHQITNLKQAEDWYDRTIKNNPKEMDHFLAFVSEMPDGPCLPVVLWSRLFYDLEPYLIERTADGISLMGFFHNQMAEVVTTDYLRGYLEQDRHQLLADYFRRQPLYLEELEKKLPNLRKLSEQPFQQAFARMKDDYFKTLTDYWFMETKIEASGPHALIKDYDFVQNLNDLYNPEELRSLRLIQAAIRLSVPVIASDKHQLAGQLIGRLKWKDISLINEFLSKVSEKRDQPWLCPLNPSLTSASIALILTINSSGRCRYSQDGRRIFVNGKKFFSIWDAVTGKEIKKVRPNFSIQAEFMGFSPDGKRILSSSRGGAGIDPDVNIWDSDTGTVFRSLKLKSYFTGDCTFSSDSTLFAATSWNGTGVMKENRSPETMNIEIWNIDKNERIFELFKIPNVSTFGFDPDGQRIVICGERQLWEPSSQPASSIKIYHITSGEILSSFNHKYAFLNICSFSPDGTLILSSSFNCVDIWDISTGTLRNEVKVGKDSQAVVNSCEFSPDGQRVYVASRDQSLKVFDVYTGAELRTLTGIQGLANCAVSPDQKQVVTSSDVLNIWDLGSLGDERLSVHTGAINTCAFSADGKMFLSAGDDSFLKLWDTDRHDEVKNLTEFTHPSGKKLGINSCDISPDGSKIVAVGELGFVKIWETTSGKEINAFEMGGYYLTRSAFSPDGKSVIVTGTTKEVYQWDIESGTQISSRQTLIARPSWGGPPQPYCGFSPDGNWVVSPGDNSWEISIWDVKSGAEMKAFSGHPDYEIKDCSFSQDGKYLVSASEDKTLTIWDVAQGFEIKQLVGHTGGVNSCCFSPDGRLIISSSDDKTLRVWESHSGILVATFSAMGKITCSAVSPSQNLICCGDSEGFLYFLELVGI